MNLDQFNSLDIQKKGEHVYNGGSTYLRSRKYYNHLVNLYDLGEFFAEVYYFPAENKIVKIVGIPLDDAKVNLYLPPSK